MKKFSSFITINLNVTCPFSFKGRRGNNMLHCAASRGRLVLADWLLDNIFMDNPNVKNDLGETPLHLAAGYFTKGKKVFIYNSCHIIFQITVL